jgi:hypothetical protein
MTSTVPEWQDYEDKIYFLRSLNRYATGNKWTGGFGKPVFLDTRNLLADQSLEIMKTSQKYLVLDLKRNQVEFLPEQSVQEW